MSELALRPAYAGLEVYRRDDTPLRYDLSDNTNLFGSAPSALASLATWADRSPARYPSAGTGRLRAALAGWLGVSPDQIVAGCGSNDILDSAMRAFGAPGSVMAYAAPTFVMAGHFALANSLSAVAVPTDDEGAPDVGALVATGARLIYLATPNNPTGRAAGPDAVRKLVDRAPGVVILDQAYSEYHDESWASVAAGRDNVVVTRTFSKAWGLAGLRLGYAVGSARLVEEVAKARGPYKVNAIVEEAAAAAVEHDQAWVARVVAETRAARIRLGQSLRALGFAVLPSDANFLAVRVVDARWAADALAARGITVRAMTKVPVFGDLLRITIGPDPMMTALVEAMAGLPR